MPNKRRRYPPSGAQRVVGEALYLRGSGFNIFLPRWAAVLSLSSIFSDAGPRPRGTPPPCDASDAPPRLFLHAFLSEGLTLRKPNYFRSHGNVV